MTPRLDLGGVRTACQRLYCPGVSGRLHRHHMGCEHMFVRHFRIRRATKRYQEFVSRYHEFRPDDTVVLCDECHLEIHILYGLTIRATMQKLRKPVCRWTWDEAEILMRDLRKVCAEWVPAHPRVFAVKTLRAVNSINTFHLPMTENRDASIRRISEASKAYAESGRSGDQSA